MKTSAGAAASEGLTKLEDVLPGRLAHATVGRQPQFLAARTEGLSLAMKTSLKACLNILITWQLAYLKVSGPR